MAVSARRRDDARMRRRRGGPAGVVGALALAVVLGASGCTAGTASTGEPAGTAKFYGQHLSWTSCHGGLRCAAVTVPEDWSTPSGATIHVGLVKQPALKGHAKGTVVFNPGGPGAPVEDYISEGALTNVDETVADAYDVVGYDPPGVGSSTPVNCGSGPDVGKVLFHPLPEVGTTQWVIALQQQMSALATQCVSDSGSQLLRNVDTVTAARDLDVVRAVLGQKTTTYLGSSYGTDLGIVYESLFPDRVDRMVLDGVDDPVESAVGFDTAQAVGFEKNVDDYLSACPLRAGCPFSGSLDQMRSQLHTLLTGLAAHPAATSTPGYVVDESTAATATLGAMYSTQLWPQLDAALASAHAGDGSGLLTLAENYWGWTTDADGANFPSAYFAISCADRTYLSDPASMAAESTKLDAAAPLVGRYFSYQGAICSDLPAPKPRFRDAKPSKPANTVLVVSATNDPSTPESLATGVTKRLGDARLLLRTGDGHTSYVTGNSCIDAAVDGYLLHGKLPKAGTRC
jgi:pimeloyl-ACP methyl ester carboxylesterase